MIQYGENFCCLFFNSGTKLFIFWLQNLQNVHDSALVRKLEAAQSGENLFWLCFSICTNKIKKLIVKSRCGSIRRESFVVIL